VGLSNATCATSPLPKNVEMRPLVLSKKLVRHKKLAGAQIFLQRADGTDGNDTLNAEKFHRVDVGAEIEFGGKNAMAAAMAG